MFDLIAEGLRIQSLTVNANVLSDADVASIKEAGLRVVCRPDNLVSIRELREARSFQPDEAA